MKVLFDHQAFSNQKYGGISRYFANLHQGLNALPGVSSKLGLAFTRNAYINQHNLPVGGVFNNWVDKKSRREKYNKWYCRHLLKQGDFDVFHPTYYSPYFLEYLNKPFVLTVHDMIHELYPDYFAGIDEKTKGYKEQVITRADHIIAISDCTKNDIQRFYNIPDNKITVIHHGYHMETAAVTSTVSKPDGKYLLFVGDRFAYKNFERFIKAVAPLLVKNSLKLICTGGGAFTDAEWELITLHHITNNIQQVSVADDELRNLYTHAEAFIYPSFYEGFGLPVLEAFYNKCPVIMSNTSSLPEVGGDAAEYFDPMDEESITTAIQNVIHNNNRQNELRAMGTQRLQLFNFETCLEKTVKVYELLK
jgi:glycosyltransferase involved in cell wall biosynthesis